MYSRNPSLGPLDTKVVNHFCTALVIGCLAGMSLPVQAEDGLLGKGYRLWTVQDGLSAAHPQGPALLRPSLSSDGASLPKLDFATGIERHFSNGLSLDAGVSMAQGVQLNPVNYRDYFLGVRYGSWDGKVWYLPELADSEVPDSLYYEAGWSQPVGEQSALSLRLGQQQSLGAALLDDAARTPNLSLGATTHMRGYGLGLRLVESGGILFGGEQDLRVMGSISKPFR